MIFETKDFTIILTDEKLEVDLKRGARAFLEQLFEGSRFYKTLRWILAMAFPRDFFLDEILDVRLTNEGDLILRERTPFGVKDTRMSGLSRVQAELLAKTIKSLLEKSSIELFTRSSLSQ